MKRKIFFVTTLALTFGMIPAVPGQAETRALELADGAKVVYDVSGPEGAPAVILVHCFGCSRTYWAAQIPELAKEYRVAALDLPGHGDSAAVKKDWSFAEIADVIGAVADQLGFERFVLVGHSMGGPFSLEAAARRPGRVEGIVCVDTLKNLEFKMKDTGFKLNEEGFEDQIRNIVPTIVHPDSDPKITERIVNQTLKSDRPVLFSLWRGYENADLAEMMKKAKVPVRCVNSAPFGPQGQKTELEINRKYGDYDAVVMEGVGHFPMLEKPAEFTEALKKQIRAVLDAAQKA